MNANNEPDEHRPTGRNGGEPTLPSSETESPDAPTGASHAYVALPFARVSATARHGASFRLAYVMVLGVVGGLLGWVGWSWWQGRGLLSLTCLIEWAPALSATHPDVVAALRATEQELENADTVSHPVSYLDLLSLLPFARNTTDPDKESLARLPEALRSRFLREDVRRAVVRARIPDHGSHRHMPVVRDLRRRLRHVDERLPAIDITLSGTPVVVGRNATKMIRDLVYSLTTAAGIIWIIMALAGRSWRLGLVIILPNALPLALAGAWLVLTDQVLTITGVITFCVVLGIAVDDTIHMIHRFKHELAERDDIDEALRRSFRTVGQAVVVTTAVFVAGLGILLVSDLPGLRMFGQIACVGLVAALFADLLVLPALLKLTGPYLPATARRPWGARQA